jgi:hypothetical protein
MTAKIVWIMLGVDALVILGMLFMNSKSDAAGQAMGQAMLGGMGLLLLLGIAPLLLTKHPTGLWISVSCAALPWLLTGLFYLSRLFDSQPQQPQTRAMTHFTDRKQRAIAQAIEDRDTAQLSSLVKGEDLNRAGSGGMNYLQFAARLVNSGEPEANMVEPIRILITAGADPNQGLPDALTYLSPATLGLFFDGGADANAKDFQQEPILFRTVRGGRYENARLLLQKGAHVNALNKAGWTFVMQCAQEELWTAVRFLLEEVGADYTHKASNGESLAGIVRKARQKFAKQSVEVSPDFLAVVEWLQLHEVDTAPD